MVTSHTSGLPLYLFSLLSFPWKRESRFSLEIRGGVWIPVFTGMTQVWGVTPFAIDRYINLVYYISQIRKTENRGNTQWNVQFAVMFLTALRQNFVPSAAQNIWMDDRFPILGHQNMKGYSESLSLLLRASSHMRMLREMRPVIQSGTKIMS